MDPLLHTIALEPARWTPRKVSQSLPALLPGISAAGFSRIEVYEPHLRDRALWPAIRDALQATGLEPVILSSYVKIADLAAEDLPAAIAELDGTVREFGFRKLRVFPGSGVDPTDEAGVDRFARRLAVLAERLSGIEILLETHDGSIADDPQRIVDVVTRLGAPNVGLLFQPTLFEAEKSLAQLAIQKPFIRHVHLQNRDENRKFVPLADGVVPWRDILAELPGVDGTIEFVPRGICPEEHFDLATVLQEAASEKAFVSSLSF